MIDLRACLCGLFVLLLTAPPARAEPVADAPPPKQRLFWRDVTSARWNPFGLLTDARLVYRQGLYDSAKPALRDNFAGLGLTAAASPSFAKLGLLAELQPASVLGLWAGAEWVGWFGAAAGLDSFPSATSDYRDQELLRRDALGDADPQGNYATSGLQAAAGAELKVKVGQVVVRSLPRLGWADLDLRAGDRAFYDPIPDLLIGNGGWTLQNDADLLWMPGNGWTAGVRWSVGRALYEDRHFAPGDDHDPAPGLLQRAGPLVSRAWQTAGGTEHAVILMAHAWLASPTRLGQDPTRPRAVPYLALAYVVGGDLAASSASPARQP